MIARHAKVIAVVEHFYGQSKQTSCTARLDVDGAELLVAVNADEARALRECASSDTPIVVHIEAAR